MRDDMTRMRELKDTMRKLKALADKGVGGEKDAARIKLNMFLKQYGLTEEDIKEGGLHRYNYVTREEKELLTFIYSKVRNSWAVQFYQEPRAKAMHFFLLEEEKGRFDVMWAQYRLALRKVLHEVFRAFIVRNSIHPVGGAPDNSNVEEMSTEEKERLQFLMAGMGNVAKLDKTLPTPQKCIEGG